MSGCVFWNHVNNFYTNILYAVYIYNHTSHVGRWRKIFSLQCLYSKLLFLRVAGDQNCSGQFSISASFGVWCLYKHPAVPDTQRLPPCTRSSSLCLHMWHTANLLPAFCFFSVFTVYQRDSPPSFLFPTMHRGLYQAAKEVKRCSDAKPRLYNSICNLPCASLTLFYRQSWGEVTQLFCVLFTCKRSSMIEIHLLFRKINVGA